MSEHGVEPSRSHRRVAPTDEPRVSDVPEAKADEYDADVSAGVPATRGLRTPAEFASLPACEFFDLAVIQRAHYLATKDALLEHARMGRSVSASRDGKIVDVSPAEIFARYGLDEFGRPKPESPRPR